MVTKRLLSVSLVSLLIAVGFSAPASAAPSRNDYPIGTSSAPRDAEILADGSVVAVTEETAQLVKMAANGTIEKTWDLTSAGTEITPTSVTVLNGVAYVVNGYRPSSIATDREAIIKVDLSASGGTNGVTHNYFNTGSGIIPRKIFTYGNSLYVVALHISQNKGRLLKFDVGTQSPVSSYPLPLMGPVTEAAFAGNYAYISHNSGVDRIDITSPTNTTTTLFSTSPSRATGLEIVGSELWFGTLDGSKDICQVPLSSGGTPTCYDIPTVAGIYDLCTTMGYAYTHNPNALVISRFDLTSKQATSSYVSSFTAKYSDFGNIRCRDGIVWIPNAYNSTSTFSSATATNLITKLDVTADSPQPQNSGGSSGGSGSSSSTSSSTATGTVVDSATIFFNSNSAKLTPGALRVLNRIANSYKSGYTIEVTGFVQTSKNNRNIQPLSTRRAKAIADYLQSKGVTSTINHSGKGLHPDMPKRAKARQASITIRN